MNTPSTTHIHILLDRSGSMTAIAPDVIGGFNTFLRQQQASGPDARITLVQFDTQDAQEVVLSGVPIRQAAPLTAATFQPRGGTPLLDATGHLIERARQEAQLRAQNGLPPEHIVFVSITDGEENQSREFTLEQVRQLIKASEAQGWTFVFLSAGLDAYGEAERLGIKASCMRDFYASSDGVSNMIMALSESMADFRERKREGVADEEIGFFGENDGEEENGKDRSNTGSKA